MTGRPRILVIGAGQTGIRILLQLRKSEVFEVITADPRPEPAAVREGILEQVDIVEPITPMTLEHVLRESRPDLVILAMPPEDMGLGSTAGMDVLAEGILAEIAALSGVPVLDVKRTMT